MRLSSRARSRDLRTGDWLRNGCVRVLPAPPVRGTRHQELLGKTQEWDERGKGVKFDRLDAAALCQRQQLMRERQRVAGMRRGLLALHNIHVMGSDERARRGLRSTCRCPRG